MKYKVNDAITGGVEFYQEYNFGPSGIAQGVYDLLAGRTELEVFAIAQHPNSGGKIYHLQGIGLMDIEGYKTFRCVGENWDPDGAASCSVISSGERSADPAIVAATLVYNLQRPWTWGDYTVDYPRDLCIFRVTELPSGYEGWYWSNRENGGVTR